MKILACDLCSVTARGETFEEWMQDLHPHYLESHVDVMNDPNIGKREMQQWMLNNRARFNAA